MDSNSVLTQEQVNETVILHVVHSKERLKGLVNEFTNQKSKLLEEENKLFKKDILQQYESLVKYEIILDCIKYLALPQDQVTITIDTLNINELLR